MARGLPAAVVTGISGCKRFRNARCIGEYGHSGAVSREYRRDAVAATVAFLHHMESVWLKHEAAGADLILTAGELFTDPAMHGPSKIAGEARFVLDVRSLSDATMDAVAMEARSAAARIAAAYRVNIDLGWTSCLKRQERKRLSITAGGESHAALARDSGGGEAGAGSHAAVGSRERRLPV